jgi:hypothetical protein
MSTTQSRIPKLKFSIGVASRFPPFDSPEAWDLLPKEVQDFIDCTIATFTPLEDEGLEGLYSFTLMVESFGLKKETVTRYLSLLPKAHWAALKVNVSLSLANAELMGFTTAAARKKRMLRQDAGLFRIKPTMIAIAAAIAAHNYESGRWVGPIEARKSDAYRI